MSEESDILTVLYQEHLNQARHQESERSTMTNLILVLGAAVASLITYDQKVSKVDLPLSIFLVMLGIYGAFFSAKLYERFRLHYERSRSVRKKLEELYPITTIGAIQKSADETTKNEFRMLFQLRLYWLWVFMPVLVTILGAVLTVMALVK